MKKEQEFRYQLIKLIDEIKTTKYTVRKGWDINSSLGSISSLGTIPIYQKVAYVFDRKTGKVLRKVVDDRKKAK